MTSDSQILSLLEQWEELRERGESPTPEELCQDCPERVEDVRRAIHDLEGLALLLGGTPEGTQAPTAAKHWPATPPDAESALPEAEFTGMRYRPLRFHARGGQGEVYLARDGVLNREVALKRVQPRYGDQAGKVRRFLREAEVCGRLQHPGIVPVYDLGHDADGQPYYAMRFIEGESLADAIQRFHTQARSLQPIGFDGIRFRQLLTRFVAACNAVAYAHSKGVIHRDLKPGNIMLGPFGETLVVDWGLAKDMASRQSNPPGSESEDPESLLPLPADGDTQVGLAMGTPAYMSPEQARGEQDRVGPATDIYSLGATLYALLTGAAPDTGDHPRGRGAPGKSLQPRQRKAGVPATLEAVCLKALAPEPADRYALAAELATEVERWLADEPVSAYREPVSARAWRWIRRHKTMTSAAAALALASAVGLGLLAAERERARAAVEAERAETARERDEKGVALDTAETRLNQNKKAQEVLTSIFHDLSPRLEEKGGPPLRAQLGERLDKAVELLEGKAVGDPIEVALLQQSLGVAQLNLSYPDRAITLFTKARQTFAQEHGPDHPDTLVSMNHLARAYQAAGHLDKAVPLYEQSLAKRKATLEPDHADTLRSMNDLASAYKAAGHPDKAVLLFEQTLEMAKVKLGADDPHTLTCMNNLAGAYQAAGHPDKAVPLLEQTLEKMKATLSPDHVDTLTCMNNLAAAYWVTRQRDKAVPLFEQTLEKRKATIGPDHQDTLTSMNNLARVYQVTGHLDQAVPLFELTLEKAKVKLSPDHPDTLGSMHNLAAAYRDAGQLDKALPLLEETLEKMKAKLSADHPDTLTCMSSLAAAYEQTQAFAKAELLRRDLLTAHRKHRGPDHADTASALVVLGDVLVRQTKYAEAESPLREGIDLRVKLQPDAWNTFNAKRLLGAALLGQKKYADAEPLLREGYEGMKQREIQMDAAAKVRLVEAAQLLVDLYEAWDRPEPAALWRKTVAAERAILPAKNP